MWELRVGGIREGGKLYRTWNDAKESLFQRINRINSEQASKARAILIATPKRNPCESIVLIVDNVSYGIHRVGKQSPAFYTKDGWLTNYAMACGYMHETWLYGKHFSLSSCNPELNTFDVKVFNGNNRLMWETFEGISEARRAYSLAIKSHGGIVSTRSRKSHEPKTMPLKVKG